MAAQSLPRAEHRAHVREPEALLRRRGQVELAVARERTAVDDTDLDTAPAVAQRQLGPTRHRLVGDAERARGQRATARHRVSVEAGPVPRRGGRTVHRHPAGAVARALRRAVGAGADAHRIRARRTGLPGDVEAAVPGCAGDLLVAADLDDHLAADAGGRHLALDPHGLAGARMAAVDGRLRPRAHGDPLAAGARVDRARGGVGPHGRRDELGAPETVSPRLHARQVAAAGAGRRVAGDHPVAGAGRLVADLHPRLRSVGEGAAQGHRLADRDDPAGGVDLRLVRGLRRREGRGQHHRCQGGDAGQRKSDGASPPQAEASHCLVLSPACEAERSGAELWRR